MSYEISFAIIPPHTASELRYNFSEILGVANENIIGAVHVYYFDVRLGWCS